MRIAKHGILRAGSLRIRLRVPSISRYSVTRTASSSTMEPALPLQYRSFPTRLYPLIARYGYKVKDGQGKRECGLKLSWDGMTIG
jgi:hypothetical protein